jgi:hypothetical protein
LNKINVGWSIRQQVPRWSISAVFQKDEEVGQNSSSWYLADFPFTQEGTTNLVGNRGITVGALSFSLVSVFLPSRFQVSLQPVAYTTGQENTATAKERQ